MKKTGPRHLKNFSSHEDARRHYIDWCNAKLGNVLFVFMLTEVDKIWEVSQHYIAPPI